MRRASLIFALIPLFVCVCAFRDAAAAGNQAPAIAVPCGDAKADLNVVTYNATIAPGAIRWATPRLPRVIVSLPGVSPGSRLASCPAGRGRQDPLFMSGGIPRASC